MSDSDFTIEQITLREIHLDLVEPFRSSSGVESTRRILLVEMRDTDGASAWGECVALATAHYLPETIDTAWAAITDHIAPRVLGHRFESHLEVADFIGEELRGHSMAKAAIEMTCWGLVAEKHGVSLSKLLGGTRKEVGTGVSLGIQSNREALVEKVAQSVAEGYMRIKVKIEPGADVEYLRAIRDAVGAEVSIMADANSAYTLEDLDLLRQFDAFDLLMIEQPLAWDDMHQHAALQKELKTPICLDESIGSCADAEEMHRLGAGRIINLKPGRVGGFSESLAIHDFAVAKGIGLWCGGMLESGIGRAYNVALASLSGFTLPGDLSPSRRYWKGDIVSPEWDMDGGGMVAVPHDRTGLGVEIDTDRVEALSVRREELS